MKRGLGVVWLALLCADGWGQSISATIQGTVRDSSDAALPGVALVLTNLDENTNTAGESSSVGLYQFLNLKPGRYQVLAQREGFATARTIEILVGARETRRADLTLPVAPRAELVEVIASLPLVNTENGTISDSKNFEQIGRLPVNHRINSFLGPLEVILAVPGALLDSNERVALGGGLPAQVDFSVDGISTVSVRNNGPLENYGPSAEILRELRATSAGAGAASGQMGDVTMATRGGGNQYHGSLFWYHQNRALDAKMYGSSAKQHKVYNTSGASLGGPVVLPGYDGHNRTFFFADFESYRLPFSGLGVASVPTAAMREGLLDGVLGPVAVDPDTRAPLPGNRLPATSSSPVARRLLAYYPLPNTSTPTVETNYRALLSRSTYGHGFDVRVDQVLSPSQRLFGRWSQKDGDNENSFANVGILPPLSGSLRNTNLVVAYTWAPAATLSNELRLGFTSGATLFSFPIRGRDAIADLGLQGYDLRNAGDRGGFPGFDFFDQTQFTSVGLRRPDRDRSRTVQINDTLSWIHGRHTLKFGADVRRLGYKATLHQGPGDEFGLLTFASGASGFSGNAFADLLLGLPFQSSYNVLGPNIDQSATHAGFFVQDSWRVHRRLTLDAGLRWEVHPAMHEAAGNIANFDHSTGDLIVPDNALAPSSTFLRSINACTSANQGNCTRVLSASQAGLPQGLRKTDLRDWGPRLGFAWQVDAIGKTVVRGSFGIYIQTMLGPVANGMTGVHTSDTRTYANKGTDGRPLFTLPRVLPSNEAQAQSIGTRDFRFGTNPTLRDPRSYQWSLTVERQIPWSSVVRATYTGLQSVGMPVLVDFNQVAPSAEPYSAARRPFPQWNQLLSVENVGFANYQGLQLEVSRRFRNDFYFQASYVLSKNLGSVGWAGRPVLPPELYPNITTVSDRFNTRYDRGNLYGSRRHRFVVSGLFPLPFGEGRTFGANWNAVLNGFLGGWELSTVTLVQSGPFQTPQMAPGLDRSNTNAQSRGIRVRPDRAGDGNLPNPTPAKYFDISAFTPPPSGAGRLGNAGAGILEGPGLATVAAGLAKTFRLSDTVRLRLETTFTNVANHPNFDGPNVNINASTFGRLQFVQSAENSGNRIGQIAARIDF